MIVDAWECGKAVMAPIWQQSRGILFYSVPHRGSPLADFNLPLLRQSIELTEIKKSELLQFQRKFEYNANIHRISSIFQTVLEY